MGSGRERGFSVTPEKLAFIEQKMREVGIETREALAEATGLSTDVIQKKLFAGRNIDRSTIEAIARKALKIEPTEIIEPERWYRQAKTEKAQVSVNIPWKQVCGDMLEIQKKGLLTSYSIRGANDPSVPPRRVQDVYVPLELVERQPNHRVKRDFDSEKYSVREQEEKTTPVSHEEFFGSVLKGQSPKSQGKRIAIIGEPGAGKTTLLQEISAKIDGIPIWIDLASLKRDTTLEEYLLHNWLKSSLSVIRQYAPEAVPDIRKPSADLEQVFAELFEQNQVWLLLDGADEMSAELGQPLNWVAQQLQQAGWVAKAKIVLTSRLNLWSSYGNRLIEFDTYRNLDFEPKQVIEFIDKWFAQEPDAREKLKQDLGKSSDRIKSLIRNPLRLTLLCITWKGVGDRLPETKAGLYQRLVRSHYEHQWKKKPEDFAQFSAEEAQDKLNQWLGELSKIALDGKDSHFQESRFRFRKSALAYFAKQFEQGSYFLEWALKLEWLHQIGLPNTNEVDADEPVYAFLHPTFQEYFAALAINDWDNFLPCDHNNGDPEPLSGKIYRVFQPQWKEVILLWLGRVEGKVSRRQKEQFVQALTEFEDGCQNFYKYQTYLIALEGVSEFLDYSLAESIIKQAIDSYIGYFDVEQGIWKKQSEFSSRIKSIGELKTAIQKTSTKVVIALLSSLIQNAQDDEIRLSASQTLGEVAPENQLAISTLLDLILNNQNASEHPKISSWQAVDSLKLIDPGNIEAINVLIQIIDTAKDTGIRNSAILSLGKISNGNPDAIYTLISLLKQSNLEDDQHHAISALGLVENPNEDIIDTLRYVIHTNTNHILVHQAKGSLGMIALNCPRVIDEVIEEIICHINKSNDFITVHDSIEWLGKIGFGNSKAIETLCKIVQNKSDKHWIVRNRAIKELAKIKPSDPETIHYLIDLLENSQEDPQEIFNRGDRKFAIYGLGEIGFGNLDAIDALVGHISPNQHHWYQRDIVSSLEKISPKRNLVAIEGLTKILRYSQDVSLFRDVALAIHKLDSENIESHKALSNIVSELDKSMSEDVIEFYSTHFADRLLKNFSKHLFRITIPLLKRCLDEFWVSHSIFHCAKNMNYSDFYRAWNSPSSKETELSEITER